MNNLNEEYVSQISAKIENLRKLCWESLGVSRSKQSMHNLLKVIKNDINNLKSNSLLDNLENLKVDQNIKLNEPNRRALNLLIDLQNRQITTLLLLQSCIFREESRGGHFRDDFPLKEKKWNCHTRQELNQTIRKRLIKN